MYAIIAFVAGFMLAQLWKLIEGMIRRKAHPEMAHLKTAIAYVFRSGGMPSGHSASMTALTVYIGCAEGVNSSIFALALATTIIIFYDAVHVRYAVGEQGVALNRLLEKNGDKTLPIVEGHTVPQVIVGVILGVIVGVITFILLG